MPDATTFAAMFGAVFPAAGSVALGTAYGPLGDDLLGTLVVDGGSCDYPAPEDVRESVVYAHGALTGTLTAGTGVIDTEQLVTEIIAGLGGAVPTGPDVRKLTILAHTGEDPDTGDPVLGLQVRIAGRTITTDTAGRAEIRLNPGSYTARVIVPELYGGVADREITIAGEDVTEPIQLTAPTLPSADAPMCFTRLPIRDQFGVLRPGIDVHIEFVGFLPAATRLAVIYPLVEPEESDEDGYVQRQLYRLARYKATYRVGTQRPKSITFATPDSGSHIVVEP
jgi:hypothetical protein